MALWGCEAAGYSQKRDARVLFWPVPGNPEPDTDLRDHELVPLSEDWRAYVQREVLPYGKGTMTFIAYERV